MITSSSSSSFHYTAGSKLECSQVIAPIKNEAGEVCMYILNFEDTDALPTVTEGANSPGGGAGGSGSGNGGVGDNSFSSLARFSKCA